MTLGLTYSTFVTQLATLAVVAESDPNFQTILPMAITYAENRMCRDIDFLSSVVTNTTYGLTVGQRYVNLTGNAFVTIQEINVITPPGTTDPELGTRVALLPVTKEYINYVYPSVSGANIPSCFAPVNDTAFVFGPWPNNTYSIELVGTIRPDSLSAINTTTYISTYLPEMMIAAAMVYVTGYQRDFGAQASDPQMGQSWENQYQMLLKSAYPEESRRKFQGSGWTAMSVPQAATSERGT